MAFDWHCTRSRQTLSCSLHDVAVSLVVRVLPPATMESLDIRTSEDMTESVGLRVVLVVSRARAFLAASAAAGLGFTGS